MTTFTDRLSNGISRLLFRELQITEQRALSPHFLRMKLSGAQGASFTPGDKLQLRVTATAMRTYTPFAFDASAGTFELFVYLHGEELGTRWARTATEGSRVYAFGPRGSLDLPGTAPILLFGDETSFAVTRALSDAGASVEAVYEVRDRQESSAALADLGLARHTLVTVAPDGKHLGEVHAALAKRAGADVRLALTGKAQSIQALRAQLKAQPAPFAEQKTKAYWSVGKRGLD
jgi:NADPH-dependent ferric siderophore reductase